MITAPPIPPARSTGRIVKLVVAMMIGLIGLLSLLGSFYTVDQGQVGVELTWGKVTTVAEPGLHYKLPWAQSVVFISTQTRKARYDGVATYSRDQQSAELVVSVNYRIPATSAERIYAAYGGDRAYEERVIQPILFREVKNVFGAFDAVNAIQQRARLNETIETSLRTATEGSGGIIESVQVENIDFSDGYEQAVEAAAQAKADIERSRSVLARVEQEAQQKVKQAEAEATATRAKADAEAFAIVRRGEAEAAAINARGEALKRNPELVRLVLAEKWNGVLPTQMIPGGTVPFLDLSPNQ